MPFGHLCVFFREMSCRSSACFLTGLFFFWCWVAYAVCVFSKLSPCWLYYLWIFSPILRAVFFIFLWIPLLCKILSVWLGPIIILVLFLLLWETDLRKHCYNLCQRVSRNYVLYVSLQASLNLSLCSVCSGFIDLHVAIQLPNLTCCRDSFPHCTFLPPLLETNWL